MARGAARGLWIAVAVVAVLAADACVTGRGVAVDTAFIAVVPQELAPPGGEDARVLHNEQIVRFAPTPRGPVATVTERRQVQVFTQAGQAHTEVGTGYSASFETVEHFAARVVSPNGDTVKEWGRKDAADAPAFPEFVLYADGRAMFIDLPDQPAGSVVETVFVKRTREPQLFAFAHGFAEDHPVAVSRFVVEVPSGFGIEHVADLAAREVKSEPLVEALPGGVTRYTWERRALPALVDEPWSPPVRALSEQVSVRLASWTDEAGGLHKAPEDAPALSRFTYSITKDRVEVTPEIQAQVQALLKDVGDSPRAKAARLYAWTRDNIRYCAVAVGMGGWVPHSSKDVEQQRYGDCKDKANLLKAMLRAAGIESRLVTIYADMFPERFRLPVLGANFNHAILVVDLPEGPAWVDPTTRTTPFGDLPPVDEDRFALPISEAGDPLTATPASDAARERRVVDARLTLDPSGVAHGTFSLETNGAFADRLREMLLERPALRHAEVIADMLPFERARVGTFAMENATPPEEVTPAFARGDMDTRLTSALRPGADALISTRGLFSAALPVVRAARQSPVLLGFRHLRKEGVRVALPPNAVVARVPAPFSMETPHARYTLTWRAEGGDLVVERELEVKARLVPLEDMAAFAEMSARVAAAEEQKAIVRLEPN